MACMNVCMISVQSAPMKDTVSVMYVCMFVCRFLREDRSNNIDAHRHISEAIHDQAGTHSGQSRSTTSLRFNPHCTAGNHEFINMLAYDIEYSYYLYLIIRVCMYVCMYVICCYPTIIILKRSIHQ